MRYLRFGKLFLDEVGAFAAEPDLNSHVTSIRWSREKYSLAQILLICYNFAVISSFGDKTTRDIFDGINSKEARRIPKQLWPIVFRKLDMVNATQELKDLLAPPGNRLEALKGNLKGLYSIRVNDQYRIIFRWATGHAEEVKVVDYHS